MRGRSAAKPVETLGVSWSWLSYLAIVVGGLIILNVLIVVILVLASRSEQERADG